ncbi:hypothetical protein CEXT_401851 [Caerostris extrusa]|uniref:Uncharacterized protein n=1 Tax=Caerostris extrusa TaxID=172846 RepID=A0AAV4N7H8_CAEEX|nr:hypothetical protein CEXT_401851 [Caerostris extrusa]
MSKKIFNSIPWAFHYGPLATSLRRCPEFNVITVNTQVERGFEEDFASIKSISRKKGTSLEVCQSNQHGRRDA